jgi:peroxiredoxin
VLSLKNDNIRKEENMAKKIQVDSTAPDFALQDFEGNIVRLSDYQGHKHVVLIFNRGFK